MWRSRSVLQIKIIRARLLQTILDTLLRGLVAHCGRRDLGREEDVRPREAGFSDRRADFFFVFVRGGGVDLVVVLVR
jgi:hypothetical protein